MNTENLIVKKRGGGERIIPAHKYFINRNTPVGDDADVWELMPYNGRKYIPWYDIIRFEKVETPVASHKPQ